MKTVKLLAHSVILYTSITSLISFAMAPSLVGTVSWLALAALRKK